MAQQIQLRRGDAAWWTDANPVLAEGELGIELGVPGVPPNIKVGDGVTAWTGLAYFTPSAMQAVIDAAVDIAVAALVDGAPAALNTLNELAAALSDDAAFAATVAASIAARAAANLANVTPGSVTTALLADGAVTAAKVAGDVATQAELDAEATTRATGDTSLLNTIAGYVSLLDTNRIVGDATLPATAVAVDYTLAFADAGKVVEVNAATPKTVTIPNDGVVASRPDAIIEVQQVGAGIVTVAPAGGVTVTGPTLSTSGPGSSLFLRKRAANTWVVRASTSGTIGLPSYAPSGLRTDYDGARSLYNARLGLRRWRAALARQASGGTVARLNCYGDSLTVGYYGSPLYTKGYVGLLKTKLQAKYGASGSGIVFMNNDIIGTADDPRFTISGFARYSDGPFQDTTYEAHAALATIAFTPVEQVDSFTIYYLKTGGSGTAKINVDGGADTNVNSNGSAAVAKVTISAGALGAHTLNIKSPTDGTYFFVYAIEGTVGTSGVRIGSFAKGGKLASSLVGTAASATGSMASTIDNAAPDLAVIMFSSNEYNNSRSLANFTTDLTTLIARVQAANGDVLLAPDPVRGTGPAAPNPQPTDYTALMYTLADSLGCAVLDLNDRWGGYAVGSVAPYSLYNADGVHASPAGQADIANAIYDAVVSG